MTYIDVADVRRATGIPTDIMTDSEISSAITVVEDLTERMMNTKFKPTVKFEVLSGDDKSLMFTSKNPLLAVRQLKIDDTTIDISNIYTWRSSGKIILSSSADTSTFEQDIQNIKIKYLYGFVNETDTRTTTTVDATAGTSVSISVSDSSSLSQNDWIELYDIDGNREVCQITSVDDSTTITVDEIALDHSSGSEVVKVDIPTFLKRFIEVEAGIYVSINAIGATYKFNASYSLGELNVSQGVPYTHWRETTQKLINERNSLYNMIKIRPYIR